VPPVAQLLVALALLAIGPLVLSATSGIRFARRPGSFRCRVGARPAAWWRRGARWCLFRTRAVWVSDVPLLRSGALRLGVRPVAVRLSGDAGVETLLRTEVRGLGRRPVVLRLTTEGGRTLEVAVPEESRTLLVGPFLAAAIPGLPKAPRERGT
jgi:hypothetical protein